MSEKENENKKGCACPFCDEEVTEGMSHFCEPCKVNLRRCTKCSVVVEIEAKVCHNCGQNM